VEGRAYLLRPDTPREGTERPTRPGETEDELSEPLRGQARESGLIMRPPPNTPNTLYSLEATEYAQQHGKFMEFHHAAYKSFWEDRKDIGQIEVLETIADSVGLDGADMTGARAGHSLADGHSPIPGGPAIRHQRHPYLPGGQPALHRRSSLPGF